MRITEFLLMILRLALYAGTGWILSSALFWQWHSPAEVLYFMPVFSFLVALLVVKNQHSRLAAAYRANISGWINFILIMGLTLIGITAVLYHGYDLPSANIWYLIFLVFAGCILFFLLLPYRLRVPIKIGDQLFKNRVFLLDLMFSDICLLHFETSKVHGDKRYYFHVECDPIFNFHSDQEHSVYSSLQAKLGDKISEYEKIIEKATKDGLPDKDALNKAKRVLDSFSITTGFVNAQIKLKKISDDIWEGVSDHDYKGAYYG